MRRNATRPQRRRGPIEWGPGRIVGCSTGQREKRGTRWTSSARGIAGLALAVAAVAALEPRTLVCLIKVEPEAAEDAANVEKKGGDSKKAESQTELRPPGKHEPRRRARAWSPSAVPSQVGGWPSRLLGPSAKCIPLGNAWL